jgi:hypothetical protein
MPFIRTIRRSFQVPTAVAVVLVPLVERLLADDKDGASFQAAIRPFFNGERPRLEIIRGDDIVLNVEGPRYTCGEETYPLGSQLFLDKLGWLNLGPVETEVLRACLRAAIDAAAFRWLSENGKIDQVKPSRQPRNRGIDDEIALRQIAAAASRNLPENKVSHD